MPIKIINKNTRKVADKKATKQEKMAKPAGTEKTQLQTLTINSTNYTTTFTKKFENRKNWEKSDPKKILSFIPGTIMKLFVKDGQKVKKGDHLLVLEAMKMENEIKAAFDGVIKKVHVKEGERLPKGYLLIEYKSISV
jgi:biotin carboxyl carrier protein